MRVLVLGAGYAGLTLARDLERRLPADADLTVVNDTPHHLVQHEVHRAIRRPAVAEAIQVPLDEALDRAEVVVDRVTNVDHDARTVELADGDALDYDYCAVCLGAETAYYGIPGLEAHSVPLKRVADAETIRTRFFDDCDEGGTVVVGGAGLSGVQVAGELAALRDEEGAHADIVLVEQLDAVAPSFDASFQRAVRDELLDRGVEIRTETTVESVTDATVEADTGDIDYDLLVWTGGIAGDDAMGGERPAVRADLRLDRRAFVVGDAARAVDADGEPVPASASAALREAKTVAGNIAAQVEFETGGDEDEFAPRPDPYRFAVPGWIVSVGDGAVAQVGPSIFRGKAAKAMKATVGAGHLTSVGAISRAADLVDEELHA
ncbi:MULTISPECIES: NAD(P)/FAD-dependent oxidoreductase [unclassified Haloferax]|uniref:NAD(P)/FAD-dependent oxidoreductase n=1 Tax=unclassified Haloferax TaxID=2625095 RepID=UPI0002B14784|nr:MULTISPECIES: FAD-dependent oxidoreductase [unclassified Haloferax]ELZ60950.1 NADH dehydrogenase [Haloferax sp. ATCC BAA-646]ELZ64267.1 NADH dehydrogenase [Haloferax sp. ATCC BAA-645]ELZ69897.1 NADH dehydrogenase [Haloferax sp. ATCC BAA-644]